MELFRTRGGVSYFREDGRVVLSDITLTSETVVQARTKVYYVWVYISKYTYIRENICIYIYTYAYTNVDIIARMHIFQAY